MNTSKYSTLRKGLGIVVMVVMGLFTQTAQAKPTTVSDFKMACSTGSSCVITWTVPTPAAGTTLTANDIKCTSDPSLSITTRNWATFASITGIPAPAAPGSTQSMTRTGLSPGVTYKCAVRVKESSGVWSDASYMAIAATQVAATVHFMWDPSVGNYTVTKYILCYGTASGVYSTCMDLPNTTEYWVEGFTLGVTYYAAIKAASDTVESVYSNEINFRKES